MNIKKIITITTITILLIAVSGLTYYIITLKKEINSLNSKIIEQKIEEKDSENITEENKKENQIEEPKSKLFETAYIFNGQCDNDETSCQNALGKLELANNNYNVVLNFDSTDLFNEETSNSYIMFNDKKIMFKFRLLDKIVKLQNNYLLIGYYSNVGEKYYIDVYDENIVLKNEYSTVYEKENNIYSDNLKVTDNKFNYYKCKTGNTDGNGQILEKYEASIINGIIINNIISKTQTYCSSQE